VVVFAAPGTGTAETLTVKGFGEIAVDAEHHHVFVSGGPGTTKVEVFDFDGRRITTLGGFRGPSGLAVEGDDLYVANNDAATIDRINTVTLERAQTYAANVPPHPRDIVAAGDLVWFVVGECGNGADRGILYLDPATGEVGPGDDSHTVDCGQLASSPAVPDTLFYWDGYPALIHKYKVSRPILSGVTQPSLELVATEEPSRDGQIIDLVPSAAGDRILLAVHGSPPVSELDFDLNTLSEYAGRPNIGAALAPDGSRFVAARAEHRSQIALYERGKSEPLGQIAVTRPMAYHGIAYSPDGTRLFVVTATYVFPTPTSPYRLDVLSSTKISARLKLKASRRHVPYGKRVELRAELDGDSRAGVISFYARRKGRLVYVGKSSISSSGVATLSGVPTRNSTFVARWAGDDTYRPSTSNRVEVGVAVRIGERLFGAYGSSGRYRLIHRGADAAYAAQVLPTHDHGKMYFELGYETYYGWRTTSVYVKMTKRGAGVGLRNLPQGTYSIYAEYGDNDHEPARTKPTYFRITG
jgi:DNA-binding beta-propeller fold protein YncE